MIWASLLHGFEVITTWLWDFVPELPEGLILASYDVVDTAYAVAAESGGFDVFPVDDALMWVQFGFWAFTASLGIRIIKKIATLVFGARGAAV